MGNKKLNTALFLLGVLLFSTITKGQISQGRSPSVEPVIEVDIEEVKNSNPKDNGYNFDQSQVSAVQIKKRVPANIVSNTEAPTNYIGPIIFLLTLPFALWLMVSKKFTPSHTSNKTIDYYPKTHQFQPYKTNYQESADDEDDIDFPKAS